MGIRAYKEELEKIEVTRRMKGLKVAQWAEAAEVSEGTLNRFREGIIPVSQSSFVSICKAFGIKNWEEIVDQTSIPSKKNKESGNEPSAELPFQPLPAIIASKLEGFVGRKYVFSAISQFINTKPNGYFTIIGDPGMGKSAILAKYVQDTGCIFHFNIEQELKNKPEQFMGSICQQLIQRYQLPYSLSPEAKKNADFLNTLLLEVAEKRNGEPVIIAVDALDEVDQSQQNRTANILYLPRYLPLGKSAIKLAANVLSEDPTQLAGQLWGRLLSFKNPEIQALLTQAQQLEEYIWLRPLTSNLTPPEGSLLRTLTGHLDWVEAVAITPDGKIAVSASRDRTLKVWDLHSGTELRSLTGHHGWVEAVAITPDGKIVVSSANDGTLKVWELQSGNEMRTLIGRTGTMSGVIITPDNQLVVSTPGGKTRIWDLQSGNEVPTLDRDTHRMNVVAITPDRKLAISASSDTTLHVRDIKSETELFTFTSNWGFLGVAITPDSKLAICGTNASPIIVYDLQTGQELRTLYGHSLCVNAIAITPDGKWAVSASSDTTLKVWNLYVEEIALTGHKDWVNAVAITPDGKWAVSASEDRTLKVWDLLSGSEIRTLIGHKGHVNAVVITPDGQQIISVSGDRTIKIWDLHSGEELRTITAYGKGEILAITPDGQHVISESINHGLRVWNLHNESELHILNANSTAAVAITPDGRLAISASRRSKNNLTVWDLHSGTELCTLIGHTNWVNAIAITPDGKLAVSASSDNTLKVWDINSGIELHTLIGHYYWVWTVAITPDGRFVVSGSWDQTLKVWDLESGEEITTFNSEGELNTCAISPDGVTIVAGGRSDRINFLRLEGVKCGFAD